jgi:hypothetical protein
MKQVYLKIAVLFIVLSGIVHTVRAHSGDDSLINQQAAAIKQRLLARIHENQLLISEGRDSEAGYIVNTDDPVYFFKHFSSSFARKFWIDRGFWRDFYGTLYDYTVDKDGVSEKTELNKWIGQLRKTYLDKTAYKDYKIYFVISGIYNYDHLDAKDPQVYNWAEMSTTSYLKAIKDNEMPAAEFAVKENKLLNAVLKKVRADDENKQLTTILNNEKYIVCFLFNFYKNTYGENIVSQGTMGMAPRISVEKKLTGTYTFVINGCFHSTSIAPELITEMLEYNKNHQEVDNPGNTTGDITTRMDYFTQMIRNAFAFFSLKDGLSVSDLPCDKDPKLLQQLQQLYNHGLPNTSMSAAESLKYLPLATRTCLLEQLSNLTFCGDGANTLPLRVNYCENLIVDLVRSTPDDDKVGLLEFLSKNNGVLQRIITSRIHDAGPDEIIEIIKDATGIGIKLPTFGGNLNYTAVVQVLCQFAYDVYQDRITAYHNSYDDSPCDWLLYDPMADFNGNSKNVLADYEAGANTINFHFRGNTQSYCRIEDMYSFGNRWRSIDKTLQPFAFIGIVPDIDLPFEFTVNGTAAAYKGEKIIVPALLLYWNVNKIKTKSAVDGLKTSIALVNLFKDGFDFDLNKTQSLMGTVRKWAKNLGIFNTVATTITEAPAINDEILKMTGGKEFLTTLKGLDKHLSLVESTSKFDIKFIKKLCDVIVFWRDCLKNPKIYTDANFLYINQALSDFEQGLVNDGILPKTDREIRRVDIDGGFISIKDEQDFQAFRQFYINDPLTTVELADNEWTTMVNNWRSGNVYNIAGNRNMARVIYPWKEFLVADYERYNDQMVNSNKFIPESFYNESAVLKRRFDYINSKRFDTHIVALEYFAEHHQAIKGNKYNIADAITIYTDLIPCRSCVYAMAQFREMFPKVQLHIITTTKLHY